MGLILAADTWPTNAALIADVARLGYIREWSYTLDPTYGKGNWWTLFRPTRLVTSDLASGTDFRQLPHADSTFDVVAFDPPYVSAGGRATTTMPDFHARYGMGDAPTSPRALQQMNNAGLKEVMRVTRPRRIILVKCQDYISSGKLWLGTHWTLTYALELGLECVDRFEHVGRSRAQPHTRQVHARRNLSTLFVFRAPRYA